MSEIPKLLKGVYDYVRKKSPEKISRREIADALGISYFAARYRLDKLVDTGRLEVEKLIKPWGVYRVWFLAIITFIHYTVVGNVDTEDEYTHLTASCTLDYDVELGEEIEEKYYKNAVITIDSWFAEMFNPRTVKYSSETSKTLKRTADELLEAEDEVTDIVYDWWWWRTGRSENKESDEGVITWEQPIPLGASGGWFTPGAKRKRR